MFSSLYQSRNNVFESINLESTISDNNNYKGLPSSIPESASATSDDELDPAEFLSAENKKGVEVEDILLRNNDVSNSLKASTVLEDDTLNIELKAKIDDQEFFSNPSRILTNSVYSNNEIKSDNETSTILSVRFPSKENILTSTSENPIEFLLKRLKIIEKELYHNTQNHITAVESGDESLNKIRSMILQNFRQLSETYYPLYELYDRELTYTTNFLNGFEQWENNRTRLLSKIKLVKSVENKNGKKLMNLLSQSDTIDREIQDLQEKINSLKAKKIVISEEIQSTSSVLESNTAKYIDSFKKLEKQGKDAIIKFLQTSPNLENDSNGVIRSIPVDVTFYRNYKNSQENTSSKCGKIVEPEKKESSSKNNVIGMVPYEYTEPDVGKHDVNRYFKDKEVPDTNAYDVGFARGSNSSKKIKRQLDHIVKLLLPPENHPTNAYEQRKHIAVDDKTNTISEKIDPEPLLQVINGRMNALRDYVINSSSKSKLYHEYSNFWKDIVAILKSQEAKILRHISLYLEPCEELESGLLDLLKETLSKIESYLKNLPPLSMGNSSYHTNLLTSAILKEAEAINIASNLISKENNTHIILEEIKNEIISKTQRVHLSRTSKLGSLNRQSESDPEQ